MTTFLSMEQLVRVADRAVGGKALIGDAGLLHAALQRPRASVFGEDAYPDIFTKAGALMHSLVTGHPLVDGNKRLGIAAAAAFLFLNGIRLRLPEDEAYEFTIAVASGQKPDVEKIAEQLRRFAR